MTAPICIMGDDDPVFTNFFSGFSTVSKGTGQGWA